VTFTGNILRDTRETNDRAFGLVRSAWSALGRGGAVIRGLGRSGGDWALEREQGEGATEPSELCRVETKWLSEGKPHDLFRSLTAERDRMKAEWAELSGTGALFLVEGKFSDLRRHVTQGGMTFGGQIWPSIRALNIAHRVPVIWSDRAAEFLSLYLDTAARIIDEEGDILDVAFDDLDGISGQPRRLLICRDLEHLNQQMGRNSDLGVQFVVSGECFSRTADMRRLARGMLLRGYGFWFFDELGQAEVEKIAEEFSDAEERACKMIRAGGRPSAPPAGSYTGPLPLLSGWRPPSAPRRSSSLILALDDQGQHPILILAAPHREGARFELYRPSPSQALGLNEINSIKAVAAAERIGELRVDGRVERDALPDLIEAVRRVWSGGAVCAVETSDPHPSQRLAPGAKAAPAELVEAPAPVVSIASEPAHAMSEPAMPIPAPTAPAAEAPAHLAVELTVPVTAPEQPEQNPSQMEAIFIMSHPKTITWQDVEGELSADLKGVFLLLLGLAKTGKTYCAASVYRHHRPEDVFWVSIGELDGWVSAERAAGRRIRGVDADRRISHPMELWGLLESLESGPHKVIVLDSLDGAGRWAERFLCEAAPHQRIDKTTGLFKLDQRGYGLRLVFLLELCYRLFRVSIANKHVIVTCGAKAIEMAGKSEVVPDIDGQGALKAPRMFSDVGYVARTGETRLLEFGGETICSVAGTRTGFPASIHAHELADLLAELDGLRAEGSAPAPSPGPTPAEIEQEIKGTAEELGIAPRAPAPEEPSRDGSETVEPEQAPAFAAVRKSLSGLFVKHNVPLQFQDELAASYGAESWEVWSPTPEQAGQAAEFIGLFGALIYYLGEEGEHGALNLVGAIPAQLEQDFHKAFRADMDEAIRDLGEQPSPSWLAETAAKVMAAVAEVPF
jgi:hypothetical protein